jgi:hypothetical protein
MSRMNLRDPQNRVKAAWVMLAICLVAWPTTSLTVFKGEPQGVLALSWIAIILAMLQIVVTTDVRNNQ